MQYTEYFIIKELRFKLFKRGKGCAAPYYHLFDAYKNKHVIGRLRGGANNPIHKLKLKIGYKIMVEKKMRESFPNVEAKKYDTPIERILDLARWTPSGDNAQPWRFKVSSGDKVTIYSRSFAGENVYEYKDGQPHVIATGMLLETIKIAASAEVMEIDWKYKEFKDRNHIIEVTFKENKNIKPDLLLPYIIHRSVNRKKYQKKPLTEKLKAELAASLGDRLEIQWYESDTERKQAAKLNAQATDIRLRIPEAFDVHKGMLEWSKKFSENGIPVGTLPVSPISKKIMKWAMEKWGRAHFMNRFMAGTKGPQIEMDIIPGTNCAAHFVIYAAKRDLQSLSHIHDEFKEEATSPILLLTFGQSLDRFWLTLTKLGLVMQPSFATLIFAHYGKKNIKFSDMDGVAEKAKKLSEDLDNFLGSINQYSIIFAGRIGFPITPEIASRSVRKPLDELIINE